MPTSHTPATHNPLLLWRPLVVASAIMALSTLSACTATGGANDTPSSAQATTTSAPANPTQPESTGIIPEKICYTDPETGEQTTQDNAVKMDTAAIEASSVYSEGMCAADAAAMESIPMGFELNYDRFVGWESKTEAQKDLAREYTFQESGMVTIFNEQYEDSFMVIGEKGGGDGSWQFTPQQWAQSWAERAAVVNAIRNDKSDPRNEEVAYKLAEGLFVEGTTEANFFLKDLWDDEELLRKRTFLAFKESTVSVTGAAKPYTEKDGTVIYTLRTEAEPIYDNDIVAKNGKRHIIMAFSPVTHVDVEDRRTTETIRLHETWTEGVHNMPDVTFEDK